MISGDHVMDKWYTGFANGGNPMTNWRHDLIMKGFAEYVFRMTKTIHKETYTLGL